MKYIKVSFPGSATEYTYECSDDKVSPGDYVQVTTRFGTNMTLPVKEVSDNRPAFPCKPALLVHSPDPAGKSSINNDEIPF